MNKIIQAVELALDKHKNQKYGVLPYYAHLFRVAAKFEDTSEVVVALLHDILEDTDAKEYDLFFLTQEELQAVQAITRKEGEKYFDYINRVKQNDLARKIKIEDLKSNLSMNSSESLIERYSKALLILE